MSHVTLAQTESKDNPKLGTWCSTQRERYRDNKLSPDRIKRLEQLGFVWDRKEVVWQEMFTQLTAYKQAHGDCNVPQKWKHNPKLGSWCSTQRERYSGNKLSPDRFTRLEDLGFRFGVSEPNELDISWDERCGQLFAYKQTHGDCNVSKYSKDNPKLGQWCSAQRKAYNRSELPPDRIKRLEDLSFVWNPFEIAWEKMFAVLTAHKQTYGDCNVPREWKGKPSLWMWCSRQRKAYNRSELPPDRIKRLEQLGFLWDPLTVAWEVMFAALTAYKQTHGDCNVSKKSRDNPKLGTWCSTQRERNRDNKLSPDRFTRLEQLGFVWDRQEVVWQEMFTQLIAYKQAHGDCHVPGEWKNNPKLARWCDGQKNIHKNNKLSSDRIKRLEEVGFRFGVRESGKK